jgi:hypothetical protein
LSYIETVNRPRNIITAVQVKDECRLLIKTAICIEHHNVKGILNDGFWIYGREEGR